MITRTILHVHRTGEQCKNNTRILARDLQAGDIYERAGHELAYYPQIKAYGVTPLYPVKQPFYEFTNLGCAMKHFLSLETQS